MKESISENVTTRLDRLERENRRLKRGFVGALVAISALMLMGQAKPVKVPKIVEAERFVLRDTAANMRANIVTGDDGSPAIMLIDRRGKSRAGLALLSDGSPFFFAQDGEERNIWRAPSNDTPDRGNFVLWVMLVSQNDIRAVASEAGLTKDQCEQKLAQARKAPNSEKLPMTVCLPENIDPIRK